MQLLNCPSIKIGGKYPPPQIENSPLLLPNYLSILTSAIL